VTTLRVSFLAVAVVQSCFPANLAVSTYFKDGFTPAAIASDTQGNVLVAGSAVIDSVAKTTGVAVAKLNPQASQYLYLTYLDSAASDQVSAMAVDAAGNAYVTGWTTNPNFPAAGGGMLGTPSTGVPDSRSFVTKLSPDGAVLFSVLIGSSVGSQALGIALTPQGQILVSGLATASGFPATPGAYSVPDSNGNWFLMELDAAASTVIFSATGIGGSSIVLDAAGNIYLAGSSAGTDYPTTPGAYQTTFVQGHICYSLCQIGFNGVLQHVTKVDPAASKLIYSTGVNDTTGGAGSTTNTGLAVDAVGNAYITGTLLEAAYPFTVTAPNNYYGYLTKLDPTGSSALFSIPVGGAGVQLDSSGAVYVGGLVSSYDPIGLVPSVGLVPPPPVFSWVPKQCWPDNIVAISEAYVLKVDPATGNVQDGQWIDGSAPGATGITLADGKVWITGFTPGSDVPFTPGVLSPPGLGPGFLAGAYLSAADFSTSATGAPVIACVLDGGNLTHVGAVAGFQLISLFGANLGPATGVAASDGTATSIAGVSIKFDGNPAQLLYVSSSQINLAVPDPLPTRAVAPLQSATVMQVTVKRLSIQRQFPFTVSNLNLFADLTSNEVPCPSDIANGFQPVVRNQDGKLNSCSNPAPYGSTVSFFAHGVGASQLGFPPVSQLSNLVAYVGNCAVAIENAPLLGDFVYQVEVPLPSSLLPCAQSYSLTAAENPFPITFSYNGAPVGPFVVPVPGGAIVNFEPGQPMPMIVWVTQ
jgi:uncharacterized protein (TIGR03437 family)